MQDLRRARRHPRRSADEILRGRQTIQVANRLGSTQIADGRWIRIEEKRTPNRGVVGFRSDITELKQRELALARQTALLTTTLEHMGEGLSVVDESGRIIAYNRRFLALLNIPESSELDGSLLTEVLAIFGHVERVLPNSAPEDADDAFTRSITACGRAVEWSSAEGRVIEIRSSALPDGGTVTIYDDVTEEREAALQIQSSEALKSAMISSALDGIIITDEYGRIIEFNVAAESIFGWRASEVIGLQVENVVIPERLRTQHAAGMKRYLASGQSSLLGRRLEVPAIDKTGREFPAELIIAAIKTGKRTRFSAYVRDISERKKAERETATAREAAEAANKAKTDFLAMVSHEFRTPMNGILCLSELLLSTPLDAKHLQTRTFDLVLMDLQMPVMGGVEAARRIRKMEGNAGRGPIVSLSAQALPELLAEASEASMNAHLTKPISLKSIATVIASIAPAPGINAIRPVERREDGAVSLEAHTHNPAIRALADELGADVLADLLEDFSSDCSTALAEAAKSFEHGDVERLSKLAHDVGGLFGQFGFDDVADVARQLETCLSPSEAVELARRMIQHGNATLKTIGSQKKLPPDQESIARAHR